MAHACNPRTVGGWGRTEVQAQSVQLSDLGRPAYQVKNKKGWGHSSVEQVLGSIPSSKRNQTKKHTTLPQKPLGSQLWQTYGTCTMAGMLAVSSVTPGSEHQVPVVFSKLKSQHVDLIAELVLCNNKWIFVVLRSAITALNIIEKVCKKISIESN